MFPKDQNSTGTSPIGSYWKWSFDPPTLIPCSFLITRVVLWKSTYWRLHSEILNSLSFLDLEVLTLEFFMRIGNRIRKCTTTPEKWTSGVTKVCCSSASKFASYWALETNPPWPPGLIPPGGTTWLDLVGCHLETIFRVEFHDFELVSSTLPKHDSNKIFLCVNFPESWRYKFVDDSERLKRGTIMPAAENGAVRCMISLANSLSMWPTRIWFFILAKLNQVHAQRYCFVTK